MTDIEISVYIEDTNEVLKFNVSREDAEVAERDATFLQQLVNAELEKRRIVGMENEENLCPNTLSTHVSEIDGTSDAAQGQDKSAFLWVHDCILLLLATYEECQQDFSGGVKRHKKIWDEIASTLNENGHPVTGAQCQTKLHGLKRSYKKILDHNNVSGNDRKTWPYFERMNEIFGASGWAQPKALASEAGPSATVPTTSTPPGSATSSLEPSQPGTSKRRITETIIEKYLKENKEMRLQEQTLKRQRSDERLKVKADKLDKLLEQKERQHKEKMEMLKLLIDSVKKQD